MNKEQAEKLAKMMREAGVNVQVAKMSSADADKKEPQQDANPSPNPLDDLESAANSFMEFLAKLSKDQEEGCGECEGCKAEKETPSDGKPSYPSKAFSNLGELASRVNLFVEHPMLVNLSTTEVSVIFAALEQMLETFEESNEKFMEASSETSRNRIYLNAIFYAVDLMMKTKADAGLLVKPETTVKIRSSEEPSQ